ENGSCPKLQCEASVERSNPPDSCRSDSPSLHDPAVLTVTGLSKRFGGQVVLDGVNWFVPPRARVALVGANGSGKSTLLRIIAGEQEADGGSFSVPKGATVGYLAQEVFGLGERSVLQEALAAFEHLHELEAECRRLEEALTHIRHDDPEYNELMAEYSAAREAWDTHGSYDLERRAESVLLGLGFKSTDFQRPCSEFSGGWQMRVALAKLLLREPDLLLLDEPTNHLDLEARDWLEAFLQAYPHTVILVAHDRYFLDQSVNRISELSRGTITDFECNYSHYLDAREERVQQQEAAYRLQREEIERIEAFISRFRYQASKAALVQSRIKQLEKIPRLHPPEGMRTVHFKFPQPERSGRVVLELQGAAKRYGDVRVYDDVELTIERGKKVALVGPNGAGKSTLMRLLAGVDGLDAGTRRVGHNVSLSYFAQDRGANLDADKSVLDIVTAAAPMELVPQVRSLLGAFLFSGDAVYKKARVLSGGERSRLALATLLLHPTNCLLLDEPTNHLDLAAKEVLLEALLAYNGTLVFVAHDRYFLDRLPEEVIEVGHGSVLRYLGNYEAYLLKKESEAAGNGARIAVASSPTQEKASAKPNSDANGQDRAAQAREREAAKRVAREAEKRARERQTVEQEIAAKESTLGELSATINTPDFYNTHSNPQSVFSEFARLKDEIESLYGRLERLEQA
ncbi:MAG TPA: ABC-F family ATP-binding cassette domain-containing protein, partial [Candidatus Acidoferrales bacterium]|nr:ABC-F family ATP-binding cassette domain-containing protein [Candidatus Acidoferrales bacterium]